VSKKSANLQQRWSTAALAIARRPGVRAGLSWIIPLALYWMLISLRLPYSITRALSEYSSALFLLVVCGFYLAFRSRTAISIPAGLMLTMLLVGLSISALWTSGQTDTDIVGGLLPYKDGKNYYFGALQILNGMPLQIGIHAVRRPLFPGLLASLLLLTGGSFKIVTAIMAQLAGFALFLSARTVRGAFGAAGAALYGALMFFSIQPRLGYTMSELPGFTLGCLAFSILWSAALSRDWRLIGLGLATLMAAISARSGAFLVFPFLALWCGWIFRGGRRYSVKAAILSAVGIALLYLLVNQAFSTLLRVDVANQWGSFAYAIYGQVHGGSGWHSAIDELNTTQASVVAAAAWRDFLAKPLSLLIGIAKSYRDFFLPGDLTIFPLGSARESAWIAYVLWAGVMLLLLRGLIGLLKAVRQPGASLLLACFAGIVLSIPFLPPVDGGARFHASTVGFLFVLPAAAFSIRGGLLQPDSESKSQTQDSASLASYGAVILLVLATIIPVAISRISKPESGAAPACAPGQSAFVIRTWPVSYMDVVPDAAGECGLAPRICLSDFEKNATDIANDDLVQAMLMQAQISAGGIRVTSTMNLPELRFGYFMSPIEGAPQAAAGRLRSGCASWIETNNSRLYKIEQWTR
jgi:hypothetical protein